jgi:hypothetical protein
MSDKVFIVPFSILLFSAQDIVAMYKSTSIDKRNKGKDKLSTQRKKPSSHLLKQRGSSSLTPPPPTPLPSPRPTPPIGAKIYNRTM